MRGAVADRLIDRQRTAVLLTFRLPRRWRTGWKYCVALGNAAGRGVQPDRRRRRSAGEVAAVVDGEVDTDRRAQVQRIERRAAVLRDRNRAIGGLHRLA